MSTWELSWSAPQDTLVDEYSAYKRKPGLPWIPLGSTRGLSLRVDMGDEGPVEFAVAPVIGGFEVDEPYWTVVPVDAESAADLGPPPDVTGFCCVQQGNEISATWDAIDDKNVDHFEIRQGSWVTGYIVAKAAAGMTTARWGVWFTGAQDIRICAVSKQGLYSETPTAASPALTTVSDQYGQQMQNTDEAGAGFTGTKTGVEVSGGHLRPTQFPASGATAWAGPVTDTPGWYTCERSGTYVTAWIDAGAIVEERVEVNLASTTVAASTSGTKPGEDVYPLYNEDGEFRAIGERRSALEVSGTGALKYGLDIKVEIDTATDGVPTSLGWRLWVPGTVYRMRQYRLRFTFDVRWPFVYPKITALAHKTLRENRKDEGASTISATGGTTITFASGRFTVAPKITGNVVSTTQPYFATFSDITTTGCKVRVWKLGTPTTATFVNGTTTDTFLKTAATGSFASGVTTAPFVKTVDFVGETVTTGSAVTGITTDTAVTSVTTGTVVTGVTTTSAVTAVAMQEVDSATVHWHALGV